MTQLIERDEILLCWMETRTRLETHLQLSPLASCLLLTILFSEHSLWLGISPSDVFVGNYITLLQYCIGNAVISWLTPIISDFQISCDLIVPISLEIGWHAKLSRKSTSAVGCALAGVSSPARLCPAPPSRAGWTCCYLRSGPTQRAAPYQGPWVSIVPTLPRIDWQLLISGKGGRQLIAQCRAPAQLKERTTFTSLLFLSLTFGPKSQTFMFPRIIKVARSKGLLYFFPAASSVRRCVAVEGFY